MLVLGSGGIIWILCILTILAETRNPSEEFSFGFFRFLTYLHKTGNYCFAIVSTEYCLKAKGETGYGSASENFALPFLAWNIWICDWDRDFWTSFTLQCSCYCFSTILPRGHSALLSSQNLSSSSLHCTLCNTLKSWYVGEMIICNVYYEL